MSWVLICLVIGILAVPPMLEAGRKPISPDVRKTAPGQFAMLSQGATHFQWFGPTGGPVLVCVHGLTTPSFVWKRMVPGLALMGFRVLTYDLYGRGFSDRPKGRQTRAFFLRQLRELLEHEGVADSPLTVMGYSMGGAIATAFAAENPARLSRLILIAPAGMGVVATGLVSFVAKTRVVGDWLMLAVYPWMFRRGITAERDAEIGKMQLEQLEYRGFVPAVLSSLRGMLSEQLEKEHEMIGAAGLEVLGIWGEDDDVIASSAMGRLSAWNSDVRHDVIAGAGHGLTYTHADDVLARLKDAMI